MKHLTITKCTINNGDPFFHISVPECFKKSFRRNMIAKKLLSHLNGEIESVIHSGDEYFLNKSYFTSCWGTPIYLVTRNDEDCPVGFFYMVRTEHVSDWRFEDGVIIKCDENVKKYGYIIKEL